MSSDRGITPLELLVIVVITGILVAIAAPRFIRSGTATPAAPYGVWDDSAKGVRCYVWGYRSISCVKVAP